MLLGLDVGGTFTDAVLIEGKQVLAQAKAPTTHQDVLEGILAALDKATAQVDRLGQVERVVISSTIVTNALAEGKLPPAFLAVICGPGMNTAGKFPVTPMELKGCVDHRGKITAAADLAPLARAREVVDSANAAVSCKFGVRQPQLERQMAAALKQAGYREVFLGSELSGELNFIRRTNSAYFAAQVCDLFRSFCQRVQGALKERQLKAPVHILKADGGTLPLAAALEQPVEAVFTGPAASVLGIEALAAVAPEQPGISLDVGGTTTDIAFWQGGRPLLAKRGAVLNGYNTAVRSFHMRSIGLGGDSKLSVTLVNGRRTYYVGPQRVGPAAAVGGTAPTLSDALIVAGYVRFGDPDRSWQALAQLCPGLDLKEEAEQIVAVAVAKLRATIQEMLTEWARQPVYTVDDIIKGTAFQPRQLIGVGGGSLGLIKALGAALDLPVTIPEGAMVANAIGAALARPTLSAGLRADTTEGYYLIPESGQRQPLPSRFNQQAAQALLSQWLHQQVAAWQLADQETEVIASEHFRTIHGYYEMGDIYNLRMQLRPGILYQVEGFAGEVAL